MHVCSCGAYAYTCTCTMYMGLLLVNEGFVLSLHHVNLANQLVCRCLNVFDDFEKHIVNWMCCFVDVQTALHVHMYMYM